MENFPHFLPCTTYKFQRLFAHHLLIFLSVSWQIKYCAICANFEQLLILSLATCICPQYIFWDISALLRTEHRLRVFNNTVLRKTIGPKKKEVRGGRRKLHNKKLHYSYCSPNIIQVMKSRTMRWVRHVASMEQKWDTWRVLMGKHKRKKPNWRPWHRWDIMDSNLAHYMYMGQDLVNRILKLWTL